MRSTSRTGPPKPMVPSQRKYLNIELSVGVPAPSDLLMFERRGKGRAPGSACPCHSLEGQTPRHVPGGLLYLRVPSDTMIRKLSGPFMV